MVCADTWKPARVPGQGDRVLTIQHTDECPAHGFACEFEGTMEGPTTSIRQVDGKLVVCGVSHDNGKIVKTMVNGQQATFVSSRAGVVDWRIELPFPADGILKAAATDEANNEEQTGDVKMVAIRHKLLKITN